MYAIPTTKKDLCDLLEQSLAKAASYASAMPDYPPIVSACRQLEFIRKCMNSNRAPTADELATINIGLLAVREFEDSIPDLARSLMEIDYAFKHWDSLR